MAPQEAIDVDIEALDAAGDGVARHRGETIAVPFTIPGERVRVVPGAQRGTPRRARLLQVLHPSPARVAPRCAHFGVDAEPGVGPCGGCTWQHIAYPEQLRLKTERVTRLLRDAVPDAPDARPMQTATALDEPWAYRHKAHFVFGDIVPSHRGVAHRRRRASLLMGHFVRGTRRIVPVRECPVHDEGANQVAFALRDACTETGATAVPHGPLKSVTARVGHRTGELMVTLVLTRDADRPLRAATRRILDSAAAPSSFHVNLHPKPDAFVFGRESRRLAGTERMREQVAGVSFLVSPTAFFQTNIAAAEILVRLVLDALPQPARVLDLYAGAGLFALPLARAGHRVTAVEEDRTAVADGIASRRLNRLEDSQCRFVARPVEDALRAVGFGAFEAAVLDPPRDGCSPEVLARLFGIVRVPAAVYISCNPEALARDLRAIHHHGYRVESAQPVDMFPHTAHIETVVVLRRGATPRPRRNAPG